VAKRRQYIGKVVFKCVPIGKPRKPTDKNDAVTSRFGRLELFYVNAIGYDHPVPASADAPQ
jgi:hypothetical protein